MGNHNIILMVGLIIYRTEKWMLKKIYMHKIYRRNLWENKNGENVCWINYFRALPLIYLVILCTGKLLKKHFIQFGSRVSSLLCGAISNPGCSATLFFYCFKQKLVLWSFVACAKTQDRCSNGAVVHPKKKASYYWRKMISTLEIKERIYPPFVYSPAAGKVQLPLRMATYS